MVGEKLAFGVEDGGWGGGGGEILMLVGSRGIFLLL